jgi:hypothetical protein
VRAHPRSQTAKCADDRMKLHRHAVSFGGRSYTVITLRPGAYARFSNNFYHNTWHILSDLHGARVLGRLLWGLSYQRVPGTLVLIDRAHIDPSPFSAAPATPIALVPSHLTPLPERAARALQTRLPLTRPAGTVRWHTPGLDRALANPEAAAAVHLRRRHDPKDSHRVMHTGSLLVLAATPRLLQEWALAVFRLGRRLIDGGMGDTPLDTDYTPITDRSAAWWGGGEVQVFSDYRRRVTSARVARREILNEIPDGLPPLPDDVDPLIWERADAIRRNTRLQRAAQLR